MKKNYIFDLLVIGIAIAIFAISCNNNKRWSANDNDSTIIFNLSDSSKRVFAGEFYLKGQLEQFLSDSTTNLFQGEILINDMQTLIKIAEPILFKIYGKENIINERPYEIYLFGDYWIMNGTMPPDMKGGTFTIAINRKTCKVIGITHGE